MDWEKGRSLPKPADFEHMLDILVPFSSVDQTNFRRAYYDAQ